MGKDKILEAYEWSSFTMRNLVKALRNSAAHKGFEAISNGHEITHIEFKNNAEFHMRLPVKSLRTFAQELANSALTHLTNKRK
jgi:hypothetical protein